MLTLCGLVRVIILWCHWSRSPLAKVLFCLFSDKDLHKPSHAYCQLCHWGNPTKFLNKMHHKIHLQMSARYRPFVLASGLFLNWMDVDKFQRILKSLFDDIYFKIKCAKCILSRTPIVNIRNLSDTALQIPRQPTVSSQIDQTTSMHMRKTYTYANMWYFMISIKNTFWASWACMLHITGTRKSVLELVGFWYLCHFSLQCTRSSGHYWDCFIGAKYLTYVIATPLKKWYL